MSNKFILAVDIGGTNLKFALLDSACKIRKKIILNTKEFGSGPKGMVSAICLCIERMLKDEGIAKSRILGLGVGLPGPVNAQKGIVHFLPNVPGWREVGLASMLRRRTGLPVYIDNDVNLMSMAEFRLGAAKGFKNVLCLTLGTGVGGGIILNGEFYRGANNASGEIGHVPINEKGPRCNCGGRACLEAYIGNEKILREARKIFKRHISLEELSLLSNNRNPKARKIWLEVAEHLGIALVCAVNLLNLDAVVIGGGVANAGGILIDKVRQTLRRRAMKIHASHVKVFRAKLGSDAGLIGGAILVQAKGA